MGCGGSTAAAQDNEATSDMMSDRSARKPRLDRYASYAPDERVDPACMDEELQRVYVEREDSEGEVTEEKTAFLNFKRQAKVISARIRHGITDDPDQFRKAADAAEHDDDLSTDALRRIRWQIDDHIHAALLLQLSSDFPAVAPLEERKSAASLHSSTNSQGGKGVSSSPEAQGLTDCMAEDCAFDDESPHQHLAKSPDNTSAATQAVLDMLHGDSKDFEQRVKDKKSSHYVLPPVDFTATLDLPVLVGAANGENRSIWYRSLAEVLLEGTVAALPEFATFEHAEVQEQTPSTRPDPSTLGESAAETDLRTPKLSRHQTLNSNVFSTSEDASLSGAPNISESFTKSEDGEEEESRGAEDAVPMNHKNLITCSLYAQLAMELALGNWKQDHPEGESSLTIHWVLHGPSRKTDLEKRVEAALLDVSEFVEREGAPDLGGDD